MRRRGGEEVVTEVEMKRQRWRGKQEAAVEMEVEGKRKRCKGNEEALVEVAGTHTVNGSPAVIGT